MNFYAITNPRNVEQFVRFGEGRPDLLALGQRGEVLPVFGPESALRAFVHAHPSLQVDGPESVESLLLGANFIEVAETISSLVEAGKVEKVLFDPVLDANGEWVGESLSWPAKDFCQVMLTMRPIVMDIARRREGVSADRLPSSEAVNKAFCWYTWRVLIYLGRSRIVSKIRRIRGLQD